jgi:hypothetical protein
MFDRLQILPFARLELAEREAAYPKRVKAGRMTADQAGRTLAAWRSIVELLEHGSAPVEACFGDSVSAAWAEIVSAVATALDHHMTKAATAATADREQRIGAMAALRRMVRKAAWPAGFGFPEAEEAKAA